jgi:hypothetical protein
MSARFEGHPGPNGRGPRRDGYRIARSVVAAGAVLTAVWLLGLILLLRWLIMMIF